MAKIELSTYIEGLRDELQRCIELSSGKDLRFGTEKVEIEVEVGVETDVEGKSDAKFRFFVFDAAVGAGGKKAFKNTQTVKLSLVPVYKGKTGAIWVSKESQPQPES